MAQWFATQIGAISTNRFAERKCHIIRAIRAVRLKPAIHVFQCPNDSQKKTGVQFLELSDDSQGHPFPEMTRGFWCLVTAVDLLVDFLVDIFCRFSIEKTSRKKSTEQSTIFKGPFWPKSTQGNFCLERFARRFPRSGPSKGGEACHLFLWLQWWPTLKGRFWQTPSCPKQPCSWASGWRQAVRVSSRVGKGCHEHAHADLENLIT